MQPSPYTPGEIARAVPGRALQLADLDERLSVLVDLHRLVGRIRVDHAARGFGKTSLLREYQRRASARGATTVWVTAGEPQGLVEQILDELRRTVGAAGAPHGRALREKVESLRLSLGVPGVATATGTFRSTAPDDERARAGARGLEDVIRAATTERPLVIFVDEIQSADAAGLRTLVYAWQHLQAEGTDVPAAVFAAGLPNAPETIAEIVTFSERLAYRPLGPLHRDAEEIALVGPARLLGVQWTPEAVDRALSIAQGYPYSVQLIADSAWAAAGRPDPGAVIDVGSVETGHRSMQADLEALFRARWSACSTSERRLLTAMARLGDGPTSRASIAEALGTGTNQLSTPRARLIDKGLVQPADRGMLQFTIPGFAAFIRSEYS
ncbi:ATP-binding protein [Curtobacterium sp. 20TX0008]|uniref:ATP-binding protein n=1 Tax=unclassified Curtobacterium TaxID=257496 RepID=UPI00233105D0|nr:ATP-binding protein [Curtobacterium sp. 20TX0008]MDB6426298.1 ATP-binding protein [Curtobacterium sp. 20TX0008]